MSLRVEVTYTMLTMFGGGMSTRFKILNSHIHKVCPSPPSDRIRRCGTNADDRHKNPLHLDTSMMKEVIALQRADCVSQEDVVGNGVLGANSGEGSCNGVYTICAPRCRCTTTLLTSCPTKCKQKLTPGSVKRSLHSIAYSGVSTNH